MCKESSVKTCKIINYFVEVLYFFFDKMESLSNKLAIVVVTKKLERFSKKILEKIKSKNRVLKRGMILLS